MALLKNISDNIGNTPLVELCGLTRATGVTAVIFAKLEGRNPGGSAKDRAALYMIKQAELDGKLSAGGTIVEPTSGNTGIGLAMTAHSRGYRTILTMPESMSLERRKLLAAFGAQLVLTPASEGMRGAIHKAEEILASTPGSFMPRQFDNVANARAHFETTGPEIWADTEGKIDIFVSAVGSGGTITGAGRFLKRCDPAVQVVAVEPAASPVLSGGKAGAHRIQGIGAGFVPKTLDTSVIDEVVCVTDNEAEQTARLLLESDGILAGISSGAALAAALKLAHRSDNKNARIAVVLPDNGERYLSTGLFDR